MPNDPHAQQQAWRSQYDTGHPLRAVSPADLPAIAWSHGPDEDPDRAETYRFEGYGPDLGLHLTRPIEGAGLWTTPVLAASANGAVTATALSAYWDRRSGQPDPHYSEHQRIIPAPEARILRVDNMDDLIAMILAYPVDPEDLWGGEEYRCPHWYKVSRDWDAVYLTEAGAASVVLGPDDFDEEWEGAYLNGWFTSTVWWLNPAYTVPAQPS